MEKKYYKTIKETLYHERLENGLNVYLLPKHGFSKTYGLFSTNFGSIDTTFVPINEKEMIKVEDGIAHFLEHKMFDTKDGDASDLFSKLGASTNAFTSSTRTAYLFSTTSNIDQCVELLLDFVQDFYLTKESVEKEKGIINQEIAMYDDDPDWRSYFGSIASLYHDHPVKIDIAGTEQTVNATTLEMLERCYRTFYHPSNMMLFVVGNIDPEVMMPLIKNNQQNKTFEKPQEIIRKKTSEDETVAVAQETLHMDVVMPKLMIALKINNIPSTPESKIRNELSVNMLLDVLFSKSSDIYEDMLEKQLINDSFGTGFTQEKDYSFIQIGSDCAKIDELEAYLLKLLKEIDKTMIAKEDFERIKRKTVGMFINSFNSPESIANMFSRYYFEGIFSFDIVDIVQTITFDEVISKLELLKTLNFTIHKILPLNK